MDHCLCHWIIESTLVKLTHCRICTVPFQIESFVEFSKENEFLLELNETCHFFDWLIDWYRAKMKCVAAIKGWIMSYIVLRILLEKNKINCQKKFNSIRECDILKCQRMLELITLLFELKGFHDWDFLLWLLPLPKSHS
jgi:hypothetical protein